MVTTTIIEGIGLSMARTIIVALTGIVIIILIVFLLKSKKHRKEFIKDRKNSDITLKEFLEDIKNIPLQLVDGATNSYESHKDVLVNLVINLFIIKIVLGIISNIPEGSVLKLFVSMALVAHLGMWFAWSLKEIGFYDLNPLEPGEGKNYFKYMIGLFFMILFSTTLLMIGIVEVLAWGIIILFFISVILIIYDFILEINPKIKEKRK